MAKPAKYKRSSSCLSYIADGLARRPSNPSARGYYP